MNIEFKQLRKVNPSDVIELMNNPDVRRLMPLTKDDFNEADCENFIANKEKLWAEHSYGPWAFVVDDQFAGWGGLQYEQGDADLALILHPNFWGLGPTLYRLIIDRAFGEMGFESVTILFPPTRTRIRAIHRLGFQPDGETEIFGRRFLRFRLHAPNHHARDPDKT